MLEARELRPERMDDPALQRDLHVDALRGLARINAVGTTASLLWRWLHARGARRVLDLACGGGDVTVALARRARGAGVNLEIEGCDKSAVAVDVANARGGARFFVHDVLDGPLPDGYDAYICSLFLHHLDEAAAVDLLRRMSAAGALLVHDLRRCVPGYWLARVVPRVVTRSPVVHHDAVASLRASFTAAEMRTLAGRAGLDGASVTRHWPFRLLLTWSRT